MIHAAEVCGAPSASQAEDCAVAWDTARAGSTCSSANLLAWLLDTLLPCLCWQTVTP